MCQMHEPEGWVHWTRIKIEAKVHYFDTILEPKVNIELLIWFIHDTDTFCLFYGINKTFTKFKMSLNITCQNKITCVANELTLHAGESTPHDAPRSHKHCMMFFGVQLYWSNACALLSHIFSILNLDWLLHAHHHNCHFGPFLLTLLSCKAKLHPNYCNHSNIRPWSSKICVCAWGVLFKRTKPTENNIKLLDMNT